MSREFDIDLNNDDFFVEEKITIEIESPDAMVTEGTNDLFTITEGGAIVYIVPIENGVLNRRKQIATLSVGDSFPSLFYTDPGFVRYRFLICPSSGSVCMNLIKNGSNPALQRNFIRKCNIPKLEQEGFEQSLVEFYIGQSLQEESFIVKTQEAQKNIAGQKIITIANVIPDANSNPIVLEGSVDYQIIALACKKAGVTLASEKRILASGNEKMIVPDIAKVSNFTCRDIVLEDKWWKSDCGVIIGEMDKQRIACYYGKGKKYYLYDGKNEQRLTAELAVKISPKAFSIGRALPKTKLERRDVVRFCARSVAQRSIWILLLLGLAGTLIGILEPMLNQKIYDEYIALGDFGMVVQMCVLIGSFMISNVFFSMVKKLMEYNVSCHVNYDLQNAVYWRIFQLPESFFRSYESADLAQRIGKAGELVSKITTEIVGTGFATVFSLFYLWRMIKYSGKLTLWGSLMVLLFTAVMFLLETKSLKYEKLEEEANGRSVSKLFQFISGIDKIRMAGAEERAVLEYLIPFTEEQRCNIKENNITGFASAFNEVASYLFSMVLFYVIVNQKQDISVGSFMAFNAAFGVFSSSMLQLVQSGLSLYRLKPSYERLKPVLETEPEEDGEKQLVQSLEGSVELEHVSFGYSQETGMVLNDVSFKINPGEYVAIVGPSGCGKSTTLKLLLGFEQPNRGKIMYDGKNLANLDPHSLRRNLGVVLQNGKLISGSIRDNITITAPGASMKEINKVIEAVGLKDDIAQMPMGLETVMSEAGNTISGGQQQRILIARAIMNQPKVLYFDEATSALDNITQAKVCESLDAMHVTRIVIAHRLSTIRNCDRILVFDKGHIAEEGNYETLMARKGLFYQMAQRQLAEEEV